MSAVLLLQFIAGVSWIGCKTAGFLDPVTELDDEMVDGKGGAEKGSYAQTAAMERLCVPSTPAPYSCITGVRSKCVMSQWRCQE